MKNFLKLFFTLLVIGLGLNVKSDSVLDKVVLYIPNRIVDAMDMFTLNLGLGAKAKAEVRATHAFAFGAWVGPSAKMIKDYNRQYGFCLENGYAMQFMSIAAEDSSRETCTRLVQKYVEFRTGIPSYDEKIYNFYTGARDYWELGIGFAAVIEVDASLHPVEIADFVTGFFFYDLKGDDYTIDDLSL